MKFQIYIYLFAVNAFCYLFVESEGARHRKFDQRIIGGNPARAAEFPFSAAVNVTAQNTQHFCGGALISNNWILTAGHCVEGSVRFTIYLGSNELYDDEPSQIIVTAEEYLIHPDYNVATLESDIALIQLRIPIEYNNYIKPIRLPSTYLSTYTIVVAIGWGQISDGESVMATYLNRVTLTTLSKEECQLTYGNQITDTMVCVDGNFNQGTCIGDSGTPLVQYLSGHEDTHVGVSSFFSANGCESPDPSGYTRTLPYVEWIKNVTNIEY